MGACFKICHIILKNQNRFLKQTKNYGLMQKYYLKYITPMREIVAGEALVKSVKLNIVKSSQIYIADN
jgi:hypothetical protein